ncbi:hypothetical protein BYT27DRAFT_7103255 [Phlegmacium glaucopus]|nr:hypothetical protein BYT27DRAFT_7103255 [Phlegmacium glaucopus]
MASSSRRVPRPLPRHERYIYTYRLLANGTPIHFMISVEPESGKPRPGKYAFRLSFKANGIERSLGEPTTRTLKVDPRQLNFVVFMFPGKLGAPTGALWSLRVWLRVNNIDHRLFGDDDLWVAKDPDFNVIGNASFLRLRNMDAGEQIYHGYVGKASVIFTVRFEHVSNKLYKYSLTYEAMGVGDTLFEDFRLRLDGDPRTVTFLIFTVPTTSMPAGAAHKLQVWIRSVVPFSASDPSTSYVIPFNDSYIYQRIWKCDSFKIGGRLDFESLGAKMIMGFSTSVPETVVMPNSPVDLHSPARKKDYDH